MSSDRDHPTQDYPSRDEPLPPQRPVKRRSRGARSSFVIVGNAIFTLLLLAAVVAGAALYYGSAQFSAKGPLAQDRIVNIPPRTGIRDMAELLRREGVIDNTQWFVAGVLLMGATDKLKAGEYTFEQHASMSDVLQTIIDGKSIQHTVTIPEGLTTQQIVQRVLDAEVLSGPIQTVPPEGSLLPETYRVTRGTTRDQLIQRMAAAQKRLVQEVWAKRSPDIPVKTVQEFITLASIIEKETAIAAERTRVAGVFVNRLNRNMRLQSDPTIIYGIVGGKGTLGRPITRSDIDQPTPYNTYTINGLPPGPIGNPGRASLEAVANPAKTKDLYFVADGTGGHVFAETYEQHLKNVAKWRSIERTAKEDEPNFTPPPAAPAKNTKADPRQKQKKQ